MSTNNLDNLFASKLKGATSAPSEEAWGKLSSQLNDSRNSAVYMWLRIAASVVVVLGLSYYFYQNTNDTTQQVISYEVSDNVNYPNVNSATPQFYLSEQDQTELMAIYTMSVEPQKNISKDVQPQKQLEHLPDVIQEIQEEKLIAAERVQQEAELMQDPIQSMVLAEEVVETNMVIAEADPVKANSFELPKVTITYVGTQSQQTETVAAADSSKFTLKKMFNSAKKLKTGELMADLRGAKEDLFNNGRKKLFNNK